MKASTPHDASRESNLFGLDREALTSVLARFGAPAFHAGQAFRWIYQRRRFEPSEWTDFPGELRRKLARSLRVDPGTVQARVTAVDGTVKYKIAFGERDAVETVWMVQGGRATLCLSSQVGCALDCRFCLTGRMGLLRHLDAGEIVGQVALVWDDQRLESGSFNLVFMGMGEPLHNYDATLAAVRLLCDPEGFGLSRRRITVSTAGIATAIERLAKEKVRPRLAVSLNATTDEVRSRLMPVNRKYPIERLLEACRAFARQTGERFTFEYVLLAGVNDGEDDMARLARIVRSVPSKLNLIPFNPVPGWLEYAAPPRERVLALRDRLLKRGVPVSVRWSRGAAARAACGQLALLPPAPRPGAPSRRTSPRRTS